MAKKQTCRNQDPLALLANGILRKLEKNPHARYEAVLTVDELNEAVLMIRAAVSHVHANLELKRIPPRTFPWRGRYL
jgi:hypothetical protein